MRITQYEAIGLKATEDRGYPTTQQGFSTWNTFIIFREYAKIRRWTYEQPAKVKSVPQPDTIGIGESLIDE